MTNYWSTVLNRRVARRRAMTGLAGTTAAAAFLAACGGSSNDSSGDGDSSGLVTSAVDSTKLATRTGILKDRTFGDPPTLDIFTANNPQNAIGPLCYGALTQFNTSLLKPPDNEVIGDLAESWEWSPDGLQVTMKLRQGVKFHNKPPVNGRVFDVDDALFSWNRFATKSSSRASVANVADPNAPVLSLTATDSRTLVMKLKEPLVYALAIFAFNRSGGPVMLPKETDNGLDIRNDLIGTGPFVMANYTPSVAFTLKRHPDYYEKDHALIEQIDLPIVPEYAAALAQFKAGNTYTMGSRSPNLGVKQEEILSVKREEPRILIYEGEMASTGSTMALGYLPGSPFLDERVRQAISMSWDRDLYIDTLNNVTKFASEGLPVETRWNSHLRATFEGWWLDPKSKDFGPNAKFFTHDIAEAKKLLSAAGFPNGIKDVTSNYVTGPELPTSQQASIIDSMIAEAGILSKPRPIDYAKEYIPQFRDGKGRYEGWAYITAGGGSISGVDAVANLDTQWWSKGGVTFLGFDSSNRGDMSGDPQIDSLIEKARIERDDAKRRALVFDIQRHLGKTWYAMPPSGAAAGFEMAWPCLANFRTNRVGNPPSMRGKWVDQTKAPIKNG